MNGAMSEPNGEAKVIIPGTCRICGCTEDKPCIDGENGLPCCWVDAGRTLCDNLQCIARVSIAELEQMTPAN
jgi:hypothetical protein